MANRILVSGTQSGLGASLLNWLGTDSLTRTDNPADLWARPTYDAIVHCAIDLTGDNSKLITKNVALLNDVMRIPHRLFVQISSVDVYPNTEGKRRESDELSAIPKDGSYRAVKLACELAIGNTDNPILVLRPTALIGKTARPNSLIKMMHDPNCCLTLSPKSIFNYVRHRQVSEFIKVAIRNGYTGIYNIASTGNLRLDEVAAIVGARPEYGHYNYEVGDVDNSKAKAVFPGLSMTSAQTIAAFTKEFA
tara:strand:- start:13005 stop:13754 length:750 start_codon:yes stop_codon:yes gene_type:complete